MIFNRDLFNTLRKRGLDAVGKKLEDEIGRPRGGNIEN